TSTMSPFLIFSLTGSSGWLRLSLGILKHLRGQRHDLHKVALPQFTGDRAEDARAARFQVVLNHDGGIIVKAQNRAVRPPNRLPGAHDHASDHIALLHLLVGGRGLDNAHDNIAYIGVTRV